MASPNDRHPKTFDERKRDKRILKQAALLWWAHILYERALLSKMKDEDVIKALVTFVTDHQGSAPQNVAALPREVAFWQCAQAVYRAADAECRRPGGAYDYCAHGQCRAADPNSPGMKWRDLVGKLEQTAADLSVGTGAGVPAPKKLTLQRKPITPATNCSSDDECPDDYICVENQCESILPMD